MSTNQDLRFEWKCPHCGFSQRHVGPLPSVNGGRESELVYCDSEEGGCDKLVALEWRIQPVYRAMKVEDPDEA